MSRALGRFHVLVVTFWLYLYSIKSKSRIKLYMYVLWWGPLDVHARNIPVAVACAPSVTGVKCGDF